MPNKTSLPDVSTLCTVQDPSGQPSSYTNIDHDVSNFCTNLLSLFRGNPRALIQAQDFGSAIHTVISPVSSASVSTTATKGYNVVCVRGVGSLLR